MRKVLAVMAIIMIIAGGLQSVSVFQEYRAGQKLYKDMSNQFICQMNGKNKEKELELDTEQDRQEGAAEDGKHDGMIQDKLLSESLLQKWVLPDDAPERITVDWTGLETVNTDIVAWIQLPAIDISYPVVQGEDNTYYLHRSITKDELFSGCLFMDVYNDPALKNFNTIIYGHNMRDGSMFAKLKDYEAAETWNVCPYFWIYTEQADFLYRVFSSYKTDVNGSTFTVRFKDLQDYMYWLQNMKDSSVVDSETDLDYGDKVVTLSTCTANSGIRQILQGVLVYQSGKTDT